jgi:hypothetical protein
MRGTIDIKLNHVSANPAANASDTSNSIMPNGKVDPCHKNGDTARKRSTNSDERIIDATMTRITGFSLARLLRKMARGKKKAKMM